jgi:sulfate adenylyltransferase subunit 2
MIPSAPVKSHVLPHLRALEAESIFIFREVAAEMQRPCLLFSGGKDSTVMLAIAKKAFAPAPIPFPIMHVDTGLNFPEVLAYRDRWVDQLGLKLLVASVPDAMERGLVQEEPGGSRNRIQTPVLLEAVERYGFDALFGGARRDEEKARAKERVFSFRDEFGQWDPKNQRPELWSLYNGRVQKGQSIRVFPLSNWTELDVWTYIAAEAIEVADLYLAAERPVVRRSDMLYMVNEFTPARPGETVEQLMVRFRTIGDANLTAAVESLADTLEKIVEEITTVRITERGATRGDDRVSDTSMEDRKREGYF